MLGCSDQGAVRRKVHALVVLEDNVHCCEDGLQDEHGSRNGGRRHHKLAHLHSSDKANDGHGV